MDLRDATLMFLAESAAHPAVAEIAQSAYDRLVQGEDIDYRVLNDLLAEASGKGVLRAMHQKYSPAAYEAIIMPVLQEVGRRAPIRSSRVAGAGSPGTFNTATAVRSADTEVERETPDPANSIAVAASPVAERGRCAGVGDAQLDQAGAWPGPGR